MKPIERTARPFTSPRASRDTRYALERREAILRRLEHEGRVSVAELARDLRVSEVTVRKDLGWLELRQRLVRTHGGALTSVPRSSELAFEVREGLNRAA